MIVDDYDPIRLGLRLTFDLEEDIEVVGDYGDGESAVRDADRTMPNVVLMDVRMPGMAGSRGMPSDTGQGSGRKRRNADIVR